MSNVSVLAEAAPLVSDQPLQTPTRGFILGLADGQGRLQADPLYAAADAAGFSATKLRLALKRLSESGLVVVEGRGRQAEIQLTAAGLADRGRDLAWVAAAYRQDAGLDAWDGRWHLVGFEIPERRRAARDALRDRIAYLFGAMVTNGLYASPFAWEPWLAATAAEHGVRDAITTFSTDDLRLGTITDRAEVASSLWPLAELATDYDAFVTRWTPVLDASIEDPSTAVRLGFQISHEIELLLHRDPILPSELLPTGFAGPDSRALYRRVIDQLSAHRIVAEASVFGSYAAAIDDALAADADRFWTDAFARTTS